MSMSFYRRNKVAKAARQAWPGNSIPTFRGNNKETKKLDSLVKDLIPSCRTKFFGEAAIRKHIIDSLAEHRRSVKKGHDYTKVNILV